jgi:hypothetical protein
LQKNPSRHGENWRSHESDRRSRGGVYSTMRGLLHTLEGLVPALFGGRARRLCDDENPNSVQEEGLHGHSFSPSFSGGGDGRGGLRVRAQHLLRSLTYKLTSSRCSRSKRTLQRRNHKPIGTLRWQAGTIYTPLLVEAWHKPRSDQFSLCGGVIKEDSVRNLPT